MGCTWSWGWPSPLPSFHPLFFSSEKASKGNPEGIQTFWEHQIISLTFASCSITLKSHGLSCDTRKCCCLGKDGGGIKVLQRKPEQAARYWEEEEEERGKMYLPHPVHGTAKCQARRIFHVGQRSLCPVEFPAARNFQGLIFPLWSAYGYSISTGVVCVHVPSSTALLSCMLRWHTLDVVQCKYTCVDVTMHVHAVALLQYQGIELVWQLLLER